MSGTSWAWLGTALQLLWVLFLFALVLFLAYVTTRLVGRRFGGGSGRYLRVIDSVPLGQNRSVSLIEVSGEVYCIGVTDHGVALLGKLGRDMLVELPAPEAAQPNQGGLLGGTLAEFGGVAQDALGRLAARFRRSVDGRQPATEDPAADAPLAGESQFADRIREQIERLRKIAEHDQP